MITGYLPPSAGRITVCGFDVAERPIEVRRRLGYLPEGAPTYGDMTRSASSASSPRPVVWTATSSLGSTRWSSASS